MDGGEIQGRDRVQSRVFQVRELNSAFQHAPALVGKHEYRVYTYYCTSQRTLVRHCVCVYGEIPYNGSFLRKFPQITM